MRVLLTALTLCLSACSTMPSDVTTSPVPPPSPAPSHTRQKAQNAETLTPYSDTMVYPSNWSEITRRRQ